jgi:hypothetical protein
MSEYHSTPFANTILIDTSQTSGQWLFSSYYGYTGSILVSAFSYRYPDWFIRGLSELFGASEIRGRDVTIGAVDQNRAAWLYQGFPIPVKTLLRVRDNDPQLQDERTQATYSAECWLLVHLIMLEGRYRPEFMRYLALLDQGKEESEAFADSFDVPYEALDKLLRQILAQNSVQGLTLRVADDEQNAPQPTALSTNQSMGRLALLAARQGQDIDAAGKLVGDAVHLDPNGEDALAAQATFQMRQERYSEALATAGRLCGMPGLSGTGVARCDQLYSVLTDAALRNKDAVDMDATTLAAHAREYYTKAIETDQDDVASWSGLTQLIANAHDPDTAATLRPKVEKIQLRYSYNGELARSLSGLCASMNDEEAALQYALVWQRHALDPRSRAAAAAYVSRLVEEVQRRAIAQPDSAH